MTSKCQVTIPKQIRDALGLKAGDRVEFELGEDGCARIAPVSAGAELAARREKIAAGVAEVRRLFRSQGLSNQEFYDLMRGPLAEQ